MILVTMILVSCKPEPEKATVVTKEVTSITSVSAKVIGSVTDDGGVEVISRGACWSTNIDPTIDNAMSMGASSGIGNFECEIKGLEPNTKYYVKAYATNSVGLSYGEQKEFVTMEKEYLPEVITNEISNVTQTTAQCGGNIKYEGEETIKARGVCWSTSPEPTIDDNCTVDGSGVGGFISYMTELEDNTLYYVKAYAKVNDVVTYGEQKSFRTGEQQTIVTTKGVTNVTVNSARCGGEITSTEPENILERGVCYSTTPEPDVNAFCVLGGVGDGSFTCNMTELEDNTTYYVKAYAKVNDVVIYGEQKTFTTIKDIYASDGKIGVYEYVDLGLPSGLKWATCNIGANSPEKYGFYLSWGETSPKDEYNTSSTMGVYLPDISSNPNYDVAASRWGDTWRMPTKTEMKELIDMCDWESVRKDGVWGAKVTGPNGHCIFIPSAGHAYGPSIFFTDYGCYYWCSTPHESSDNLFAYFLSYDLDYGFYDGMDHSERTYGLPIRPVSE